MMTPEQARFRDARRLLRGAPACPPDGPLPCGPGWYMIHGELGDLRPGDRTRHLWYGSTRDCLRRAIRAAVGLDPAASPALAAIALRLPDAQDADVEETPPEAIRARVAAWAREYCPGVSWVEVPRPFRYGRPGPCMLWKPPLNRFYWRSPVEQHRLARLTTRLALHADVIDISSFPGSTAILRRGLQNPGDRAARCVSGLSAGLEFARRERQGRGHIPAADAVLTVLRECATIQPEALAKALRRAHAARSQDAPVECGLHREPASSETDAALAGTPIGAWFAFDCARAVDEARRAARCLHGGDEAEAGAIAVAAAAARVDPLRSYDLFARVLPHVPPGPTRDGLLRATHITVDGKPWQAAAALGVGQGDTCAAIVPFALWCAEASGWSFLRGVERAASVDGSSPALVALVGGVIASNLGPGAWMRATGWVARDWPPSWRLLEETLRVSHKS